MQGKRGETEGKEGKRKEKIKKRDGSKHPWNIDLWLRPCAKVSLLSKRSVNQRQNDQTQRKNKAK